MFSRNDLNANISYTGVARWQSGTKIVRLYDIITELLVSISGEKFQFVKVCLLLANHILESLQDKIFKSCAADFELHILARHQQLDAPMIMVISSFRTDPPWTSNSDLEYSWHFPNYHIFFKAFINETDVIFGGSDQYVTLDEKARIRLAVSRGANAFDVSEMASKIMINAASRTIYIGRRTVSIVFPQNGLVDTNFWNEEQDKIIGFIPRMVMSNGSTFGPSNFPVELNLISQAHLPRNSLFFKSLLRRSYKRRRIRRLIFRKRGGLAVPSLMGLLMLGLFGAVPAGYTDFGLNSE